METKISIDIRQEYVTWMKYIDELLSNNLTEFWRDTKAADKLYIHQHINLMKMHIIELSEKMNYEINPMYISIITKGHDLFKVNELVPCKRCNISLALDYDQCTNTFKPIKTRSIIQQKQNMLNIADYISKVLNIEIDPSTDLTHISEHALLSAAYISSLYNNEEDNVLRILLMLGVLFHSSPILHVYKKLSPEYQTLIDIIRISDKLSSLYIKGIILNRDIKKKRYYKLLSIVSDIGVKESAFDAASLYAHILSTDNKKGNISAALITSYYVTKALPYTKDNKSFLCTQE